MGRMKEVFTLKQELVALDQSYANLPDSYFFDIYIQIRLIVKELDNDSPHLPHDTWDGGQVDEP